MQHNWAIILAAGSSRRMGTQKMIMPYGKSTILETVIDNVLNSKVDNIVVVLGADQDKIRHTIELKPVEISYNRDHEKGMLSSVICGIRSLPADAETALIFLGDQPGIPPEIINSVIDAYNEELKGIVIPVHNYRRGHPLLVDLKYRKQLESLDLEEGLRKLRHHFPEDVLELEVDEAGILVDIDTREDYEKATNSEKDGNTHSI
jgi:molybdenum cofactor cytidylyltransferase